MDRFCSIYEMTNNIKTKTLSINLNGNRKKESKVVQVLSYALKSHEINRD